MPQTKKRLFKTIAKDFGWACFLYESATVTFSPNDELLAKFQSSLNGGWTLFNSALTAKERQEFERRYPKLGEMMHYFAWHYPKMPGQMKRIPKKTLYPWWKEASRAVNENTKYVYDKINGKRMLVVANSDMF